jgi:hypothetical protein
MQRRKQMNNKLLTLKLKPVVADWLYEYLQAQEDPRWVEINMLDAAGKDSSNLEDELAKLQTVVSALRLAGAGMYRGENK